MRTEIEIATTRAPGRFVTDDHCPFYRPGSNYCRAALPGLRMEWRRRKQVCTSDDHDYCTVFMAKILRSSRPKASLETWPLHQK
jgi:hypothetical protein